MFSYICRDPLGKEFTICVSSLEPKRGGNIENAIPFFPPREAKPTENIHVDPLIFSPSHDFSGPTRLVYRVVLSLLRTLTACSYYTTYATHIYIRCMYVCTSYIYLIAWFCTCPTSDDGYLSLYISCSQSFVTIIMVIITAV